MTETPTEKQQVVLTALRELEKEGVHPTARSLADRLETRVHESERFSDDEIRGLLERLEANGYVVQYTGDDTAQRYKLAEAAREEDA